MTIFFTLGVDTKKGEDYATVKREHMKDVAMGLGEQIMKKANSQTKENNSALGKKKIIVFE